MRKKLTLLILLIAAIIPATLSAGNPKKYFEEIAQKPNYEYSYISPMMLKAMGNQYLKDNIIRFDVRTSDITSIENISSPVNGQDDDLWDIISKIKKDNKMEPMSTKKTSTSRYDVLAKLTNNGKFISHLLVVSQNGGQQVNVVYMVGKIPIERFKYFFIN